MMFVCLSVCVCPSVTLLCHAFLSRSCRSVQELETTLRFSPLVYVRKFSKSCIFFQDREIFLTKGPSGHLALRVFSSNIFWKQIQTQTFYGNIHHQNLSNFRNNNTESVKKYYEICEFLSHPFPHRTDRLRGMFLVVERFLIL